MKLSDKNREIFIELLHQKLEEYSKYYSNNLLSEQRTQPFGEAEEKVVKSIIENPEGFKSYFEKVLWQCGQSMLFDTLCVIDGVADPDDVVWSGVLLIDRPADFDEQVEFLHDEF